MLPVYIISHLGYLQFFSFIDSMIINALVQMISFSFIFQREVSRSKDINIFAALVTYWQTVCREIFLMDKRQISKVLVKNKDSGVVSI